MNCKVKHSILFVLMLLPSVCLYAQDVKVRAGSDSTQMIIGDQFKVFFEVIQLKDYKVKIPDFQDTIISKIEIIESYKADTTYLSNMVIKVRKEFLVTSFDTGFFLFPAFPFPVNNGYSNHSDTLFSEPFYANFYSIPIDTTKGIFDIKKPIHTPLTFKEVLPYIIYSISGLLFIAAVIYVIRKRKKNEPVLRRIKPSLPPHVIALDELEKLKEEKLWQQGLLKEYYTRLTDIIRTYLEGRFEIPAMEQVTDETAVAFRKAWPNDEETQTDLITLLETADYVKFAKAEPLPEENDRLFKTAWKLVKTTIPVVTEAVENETIPDKMDIQQNNSPVQQITDKTEE